MKKSNKTRMLEGKSSLSIYLITNFFNVFYTLRYNNNFLPSFRQNDKNNPENYKFFIIKTIFWLFIVFIIFLTNETSQQNIQPLFAVSPNKHCRNSQCKSKIYKLSKSSHSSKHIVDYNDITKNSRYAAIVVDPKRNIIVYKKNEHARRHPASLTKMMTLYIVFDEIKRGKLSMGARVTVSKAANMIPPSRLPIANRDSISVKEAIEALIIKSANNISFALAERIAGNEPSFVRIMNKKAKQLGMKHTHFTNSHGWHNPNQYTTAYDMALLGLALQKNHPDKYKMFSQEKFNFRGQIINTHNHVLKRYQGIDGIKTGYVLASGFNLVTSIKNPNYGPLIAVVMGGATAQQRDQHMVHILESSYGLIGKKFPKVYADKSNKKNEINILKKEKDRVFLVENKRKKQRILN